MHVHEQVARSNLGYCSTRIGTNNLWTLGTLWITHLHIHSRRRITHTSIASYLITHTTVASYQITHTTTASYQITHTTSLTEPQTQEPDIHCLSTLNLLSR